MALVTEHPDIETKCEDLCKALLVLFYLAQSREKDNEVGEITNMQEIVDAIIGEIVGRFYPNPEVGGIKVSSFFELSNKGDLDKIDYSQYIHKILEQYPQDLTEFYCLQEIKNKLSEQVLKSDIQLNVNIQLKLDLDKLYFLKDYHKYSLKNIIKIRNFFLGKTQIDQLQKEEEIDEKQMIRWIFHASLYRNSYERNKTEIKEFAESYEKILQEKRNEFLSKNPVQEQCQEILQKRYNEQMTHLHRIIMPMNETTLRHECQKRGYDHKQLVFNAVSNLLKNACQAPECPHYLKLSTRIGEHMHCNANRVPAFHKACRVFCDLPPQEIYDRIISGAALDMSKPGVQLLGGDIGKIYMNENKAQVLKSIELYSNFYEGEKNLIKK